MKQLWNWTPLILIGALIGRLVSDEAVVLVVLLTIVVRGAFAVKRFWT